MKQFSILIIFFSLLLSACNSSTKNTESDATIAQEDSANIQKVEVKKENSLAEILAKKEIPVLCYHRISEGNKGTYTVSEQTFTEHIKTLSDSGFHSVSPDELYDYLVFNQKLPENPFMITFDDSRIEHFEIAAPILEKYGYRGVFFIMTITYSKKNYMSTEQIKTLSDAGHTIGLHSWDHTMATKYNDSIDWEKQVIAPKQKLEKIIGKTVDYWAYPNGVSNHKAALGLSKHFKLSFILSSKRDTLQPLQTVRRIIVPDYKAQSLLNSIRNSFNKNLK
jgi:peptidoglycan/xylan/chitin deacetylase (PgdA/CDA1 family)